MAFPWELNLNGAYRDKKWDFPDQLAGGRSTSTVFGGATEKLDERRVDSEEWERSVERSAPRCPGKHKASVEVVRNAVNQELIINRALR
jgi:hypothetical protein